MSRKSKDFQNSSFELIEFFRANPVLAAQELLFVDLPAPQRIVFEDMWKKPFTLVTAGRGAGKCITGDSFVYTDRGLETIESMGSELSVIDDIDRKIKAANKKSVATKWVYDGIRGVNSIKTRHGYRIAGTDEHRVLVLLEGGLVDWKYSNEIRVGDKVVIDRCIDLWSTQDDLKEGEATLLGSTFNNKGVPSSILKGTKRNKAEFLKVLFECDGGCEKSAVTYCTMSSGLARHVQYLLLNFGIISSRRKKIVKYKGIEKTAYVIHITSININIYAKEIGFISDRKNKSLESLCSKKRNPNLDVVYGLEDTFKKMWDKTRGVLTHVERDLYKKYKLGYYNPSYESLKKSLKLYPYRDESSEILLRLIEQNYFFDEVVSVSQKVDKVYDLVVPDGESFVANGFVNHNTYILSVFSALYALLYPGRKVLLMSPSFRQSKTIFEEVAKRYIGSPILREACVKKPVTGSDRCYLHLRGHGDRPGAAIEAYPLGTGEKVRGLRGHVILADEFAQIPKEIFDTVIRPMGAATASPMENVRRVELLKERLERGVITSEDYDKEIVGDNVNKIVGVSSAYYQFNHMYDRIRAYEEEITKGSNKYSVHYISYKDMPEGFLDKDNVEEAKISMSKHEFSMEYDGVWESDSDGAFKASLVEKCKDINKSVQTEKVVGREYILGIDPARSSDAFAMVVIEKGNPSYVVNAYQVVGKKFPEMAHAIFDLCDKFSVSLAMMDAGSGGGGVALKDLLANEQFFKGRLIIDIEDEEYKDVPGRRILKMHDPKPKSIASANFAALNLLERGMLKFAKGSDVFSKENEKIQSNIDEMIKQMISIVITETKSGLAHFDIPSTGKGNRKKDLYSAFILAAQALYDSIHTREEFDYNIPGLVKSRSSITSPPTISRILNIRGR